MGCRRWYKNAADSQSAVPSPRSVFLFTAAHISQDGREVRPMFDCGRKPCQEGSRRMSETSPTEYRLVLLNGSTGRDAPARSGRLEVPIGRDAAAELRIDDQLVSRVHVRVWFDGRSWQIEDCGSRNGTQVNSQPIQRAVLQPGDLIRIGDRLILFASETNGLAKSSLRPTGLTANTGVVRISEPGKREALVEQLRGESSSRPVRNLALLCRLATAIHLATDVGRLARLATDALRQATAATVVRIWLIGAMAACDGASPVVRTQRRGRPARWVRRPPGTITCWQASPSTRTRRC